MAWQAGVDPTGMDSIAVQIAPRDHWPEMHAVICVVSDAKKGTSSTAGMQRTVETSSLLQHRINDVVPKRMVAITKAILDKNFDAFARITMADSNSFHAVALDTEPPVFYMNDVSRGIVGAIVEYNRASVAADGKLRAAYTFDAGPNAVIYTLREHVPEVIRLITRNFPPEFEFIDNQGVLDGSNSSLPPGFDDKAVGSWPRGSVKSIIHTTVGDGPLVCSQEHSLLGSDGVPKSI